MRRFLTRRLLVIYAVVVALVAGGAVFLARRGSADVQYRTTTATLGTVTQTVALSGNLAPVGESDLDFAASGKVLTVSATVGQQVTAGTTLATLDPTTAQNAVTTAQANLSSAEARLSLDEAGPTAQSLASAEGQVSSAQVTVQNDQTNLNDTMASNQQAVQQAQSTLQAAQNTETSDCNANPSSPQCSQDQQQVQQDQNALQASQVKAQQSNDQAREQLSAAQVQLSNAQQSLSALRQGTSSQQIQMDQSQVQIDQVNVNSAQAALNNTTLTAPADGTVAQVNIAAGQQVSGGASSSASSSGSTTHAIVVISPGAFEVTGSVSDAQVSEITSGQQADVVPAGSSEAITGHVTTVAVEATVSSGVATFPVTVVLDGSNPALRAGMSASVSVVVNRVVQVLTVPTSVVRTTANGSSVQVLVGGVAQTRSVQVGASDAQRTQILSGLNEGDQVVVATITSSVPTSGNNGGLFGGGGRGGQFGGGFGGGGGGRGGGAATGG